MFKYDLGIEVKDKVTGFKGFIVGRADYLTGCNQYAVQPSMNKGSWVDNKWFDEHRVEVVGKKKITLQQEEKQKPGCDITPPKI